MAGLTCLMLWPVAGAAHPHVFVDTGIKLVLDDQGQLAGVEVSWAYDALYSMLTFEDMGLDNDYDGRLNSAELGFLNGFDLNWVEGFEGDLHLEAAGVPIALGAPEGRGVTVEDARIVSTHYRPLVNPTEADGLILRAYDPTFYTAYDLTRGVTAGEGCRAEVTPADLDAAYTLVEEMLYAMPAADAEESFPEVGAAFADTVVIRCDG
ncbi:DUF1007 family protein [Aestuariivita sp.]|jgi:ABC-type uncharacterized transport system substrate-binding protein|uniref:DUF1007 family protein n=1 Tax=Aestuariivita sp. TaxID=1872407 RepID=UPI00216F101E|nr:DUF1007 family protein [Aestuariivita sp.]MCE8008430.1 DUF1007 family protein [Aestuariivita sp.]